MVVPVLMYDSDTMLLKEKESFIITAVQMDNIRGLLGIRRMDRVPNARIREFCGKTKGVANRENIGLIELEKRLGCWTCKENEVRQKFMVRARERGMIGAQSGG